MAFPTSPTDGQLYNGYIFDSTLDLWKKDVATADSMFPIGMSYIQFPNMSSPIDLGWPGTWTNVSSEYAGDFFRAEGGEANPFDNTEQSDAIRNMTGYINAESGGYGELGSSSGVFYSSDSNNRAATGVTGYTNYSRVNFDVSRQVPTASENRPVNKTIRIWKRTA